MPVSFAGQKLSALHPSSVCEASRADVVATDGDSCDGDVRILPRGRQQFDDAGEQVGRVRASVQ